MSTVKPINPSSAIMAMFANKEQTAVIELMADMNSGDLLVVGIEASSVRNARTDGSFSMEPSLEFKKKMFEIVYDFMDVVDLKQFSLRNEPAINWLTIGSRRKYVLGRIPNSAGSINMITSVSTRFIAQGVLINENPQVNLNQRILTNWDTADMIASKASVS